MRQGVTLQHIGGTFQVEEQPPQHHPLDQITLPSSPFKKSSPVPYLFGGLAAMLGLIAFALLMLACSYWKLSGYYQDNAAVEDTSSEATTSDDEKLKVVKADATYLNSSMLVIMAGDEKPTFLATLATSRVSSFGDSEGTKGSSSSGGCCGGGGGGGGDDEAAVVIEGEDKRPGDEIRMLVHGGDS